MRALTTVGVIGGSGLYQLEGLREVNEVSVETPFGPPSDAYLVGHLGDVRLVFLPRHGRGHRLLPHEINYAANIYGLKQLGATYVLSISAVGSLREHICPGHIVLPDQFIDRTRARRSTFFGDGVVAHISFADPVCPVLHALLRRAAEAAGATVHPQGSYIVIDGPAFSTRAESHMYRAWGADVVGMTNLPEARLAREAELCYATVALSTDYDCWHAGAEDVTAEAVVAILRQNVALAQSIVAEAIRRIGQLPPRTCVCESALRQAIMTAPERIPVATYERLRLLIGRYIPDPSCQPRPSPGP
ncbi:MAG: S-methyl-5'-thioadenosine phosphorylase [Myxococcales bacterium]|nr:S-methyl-5'-thioadenosine phosphorylase [Myxococcota bacterium]MDW8280841.1 S-methyl-5'-thioadenosine phosphorylase [Myxococcales bacterium]